MQKHIFSTDFLYKDDMLNSVHVNASFTERFLHVDTQFAIATLTSLLLEMTLLGFA